ncbi:MAG: type VI secretion system membrane subunit TssM [Polyangiaceae bacterium]|nr:type VI secretion system membrane subunit TssM [Polyangiaceae bacterium]
MWLWILGILLILLSWAAWFFLRAPEAAEGQPPSPDLIPMWVPIVVTAVILGLLILWVVWRRVRAARAARALEKAIAQQAQEQVLATKPENRAEVIELQRQMLEGIKALKASRLGDGKGGNALYALPWYAIVGPPGAGKTTALRHSGLSFPFLDQTGGGGVRGVGGTRNCDWWFTNDAILLDTAGRYTTESDDRDEWFAFLNMLRTYRKHKPLNGIVVAVSAADLIDASDEEVQQVAGRVRDRIDEMMAELKMVLPVYVMFTKCDLIAGFVEFFEDMKRSERGQPWGATLALASDKSQPGKIFEREFDVMVEKLHERSVRRLAMGRGSRREREKVYQFPLEFAAVKQNLADFMAAAFRPAPPPTGKKAVRIPDPILRGFYFTSGTQEGKPLDRVVGAMGRAFGLRPADKDEPKPTEGKSYFLKDVFTNIIFADKDVAGRTEDEIRRVRWQRVLVAAGAVAFALLLCLPALFSYFNNRALVNETRQIADDAANIDWKGAGPSAQKVAQLDALRDQVKKLDQMDDSTPVGYRWGMFQGEKLFQAALGQYVSALRQGFLLNVKQKLEDRLDRQDLGKETYYDDFNRLKAYLLLGDGTGLKLPGEVYVRRGENEDFMKESLAKAWAEFLQPGGSTNAELLGRLQPHVDYYVDLMKRPELGSDERGWLKGEVLNQGIVDRARRLLSQVSMKDRYYDLFVDQINRMRDDKDNFLFPPVTLESVFADRPGVVLSKTSRLGVIGSIEEDSGHAFQKVPGAFTYEGYRTMIGILKGGVDVIKREQWVVPLSKDEEGADSKIKETLAQIREDYEKQYVTEWQRFLQDIYVVRPETNEDAIRVYRALATKEWPYQRIVRAVKENTQFVTEQKKKEEEKKKGQSFFDQAREKLRRKLISVTKGIDPEKFFDDAEEKTRPNPIPKTFESLANFGLPEAPKEGDPPPDSQLSGYVAQISALAGEMQIMVDSPPSADTKKAREMFEIAVKDAEKRVLAIQNKEQQDVFRRLLFDPLYFTHKAVVRGAGQAASGLWEVTVWPEYRDKIRNRYPFNALAKRDASFEDAKKFFAPKEGTLWGFYEEHLKDMHTKNKHKFVPSTGLQPKAAKRFTPFSPNLYHCLERADEITEALWAGGTEPKLRFEVNVRNVSPIVMEVAFAVGGEKKSYRNEKEFWKTFEWPGPKPKAGAVLSIRGAGGLDEEIKREGEWGLFRLFEAATVTAVPEDDQMFTVSWQTVGPPVTVTIQVKPERAEHPFPLSFFRDTNCPPSIGDRLGGP